MFLYQSTRRFFAVVSEALEELAAGELEALGARDVRPAYRGVHFVAGDEALARVVYASRLPGRILAPLTSFACHSDRYLRRRAAELPWEELLTPAQTFAVSATVSNSRLRHSQYAALVTKDAICDRLREHFGARPSVDRRTPDLRIHAHIQGDKATLSADLGDGSRHRRGYREEAGPAPLTETVAAAVIEHAGYDGKQPLLDPLCGAGTLLAEAVLRAGPVAAAFALRRFGWQRLPDFDAALFERVRGEIDARRRPLPSGRIQGSDADPTVVAVARRALARVPGAETVTLEVRDFRDHPGLENGVIVCNPPWGVRLGDAREAGALARELGDFLKQRCRGSVAYLLLGERALLKHVGLRPARRIPLPVGGRDGRLVRYELY